MNIYAIKVVLNIDKVLIFRLTKGESLKEAFMFAVVSDIHSNIEALSVVLNDIVKRGIKTIYCLGDVLGYGPNPKECLDLIINKTKWCILGNHDYAVFYEPTNFNYGAEQASFWSREVLETEEEQQPRNTRWSFLGELPMRRTFTTKLGTTPVTIDFVHASPRRPINEYIFPDDVPPGPRRTHPVDGRSDQRARAHDRRGALGGVDR